MMELRQRLANGEPEPPLSLFTAFAPGYASGDLVVPRRLVQTVITILNTHNLRKKGSPVTRLDDERMAISVTEEVAHALNVNFRHASQVLPAELEGLLLRGDVKWSQHTDVNEGVANSDDAVTGHG